MAQRPVRRGRRALQNCTEPVHFTHASPTRPPFGLLETKCAASATVQEQMNNNGCLPRTRFFLPFPQTARACCNLCLFVICPSVGTTSNPCVSRLKTSGCSTNRGLSRQFRKLWQGIRCYVRRASVKTGGIRFVPIWIYENHCRYSRTGSRRRIAFRWSSHEARSNCDRDT